MVNSHPVCKLHSVLPQQTQVICYNVLTESRCPNSCTWPTFPIYLPDIGNWVYEYNRNQNIFVLLTSVIAWRNHHSDVTWPSWASYQISNIAGCACAGNAENVFPRRLQRKLLVSDPACITARASRTCRDACRDRLPALAGKTFPAFPAHAHPQFYASGKRPMGVHNRRQLDCLFNIMYKLTSKKYVQDYIKYHDGVTTKTSFPQCWSFVRGIDPSPIDFFPLQNGANNADLLDFLCCKPE